MTTKQIYNGDWDDFCKIQRINPEFHNDGMYYFINHHYNGCWCTTRCSFSDKDADHLWLTITRKGNNTFGRLYPYEPYNVPSDVETMVETGTDYSNRIKQLSNLSFDGIRNSSRSYIMKLPKETRDLLYEALERGTAIIGMDYIGRSSNEEVVPFCDEYEMMEEYIFVYGKMHWSKLSFVFQELYSYNNSRNCLEYDNNLFQKNEINIIDYGCGQALGTICYADFLKKQGISQKVNTVTLIDPSALSLKRAALHVSLFFPNAKIVTINKTIKDLNPYDLYCFEDTPTMHLFSNVLDVIDAEEIANIQTIIENSVYGFNQFVCVGPQLKTHCIDIFSSHIGRRENVINGEKGKYELVSTENWTCEYSCFTIDRFGDFSNDAEEWYNRGLRFKYGFVAGRDMKKAMECFKESAIKECAKAQYELGLFYAEGSAVVLDNAIANNWLERSANHGCKEALTLLAIRYIEGKGLERDYYKAYSMLKQASSYGSRRAASIIQNVDTTYTIPHKYSIITDPIPYNEFKEMFNYGLPVIYRKVSSGVWYSIIRCPINKKLRLIPIYSKETPRVTGNEYYAQFGKTENGRIFARLLNESELS